MRKSLGEIRSTAGSSVAGMLFVLLSIVSFIVGLWVVIAIVRVVMG